jgi:hypothetical protein
MESKLEKEVRFLKAYAIVATLVCAVLILSAFTLQNRKQKFPEIDVERINIVERDGKLKMVMSNNERLPDPTIGGETFKRQGIRMHGVIFYNELGDESGGFVYGSEEKDGKYAAGALLTFDQYKHDQILGLMYNERDGRRETGFNVIDQPTSLQANAQQRVFVGRTRDRAARVTLYDTQGKPRLQMFVDATGTPKLEFLDETGKVTKSLPDSSENKR